MAKKSCPSSVAVVNQTWPPITTGVDQPRWGIPVFHLIFSVSLQWSGKPTTLVSPDAEAWPSPEGPRNSGQSARAACAPEMNIISNVADRNLFMDGNRVTGQ